MGSRAYVPGFETDLFLSYAREDGAWVNEFQTKLAEALIERGLDASLWRDVNNIRFGQNWKEQMFTAIERTALFLAILSPNYQNSDYCNDESDQFQELRDKARDWRIGDQGLYRYLKVIKMPSEDGWHADLLPELQYIEFFLRDAQKQIDLPISFSSQEFDTRIRQAAHAIHATLRAMRRLREMVYVASPADDLADEWRELRDELRAQGYVVAPDAKLNRGLADEAIRKQFRGAVLTIHMLGAEYHPLAEKQIDLCAAEGQRMAVWIGKGAETTTDPDQRKLLDGVRDFSKIPKGTPMIEGAKGRQPLHDLLELLKPQAAPSQLLRDGNGSAAVYLICDPTAEQDRNFAVNLEKQIEATEKMRVVLPRTDIPGAAERHRQLLAECDGVLLYREQAPEPWFFQNFTDVARAEKMLKRPPLKSKAVLAASDYLDGLAAPASVKLLGRTDPFSLAILEPFLAPLRAGGAEVAHAGG